MTPLAFDRALPRLAPRRRLQLAFDRDSVREYTQDGHLRISDAVLSKAEVSIYLGAEVPGLEKLGLDPNQRYPILRPPDELARAAPTFRMLPVLWGHQPLSAENHPAEIVIGATGSDVTFQNPALRGSLVIWSQIAIDAIEDGIDNLSAAYHYTAQPENGVFNGVRYQLRMQGIVGNHLSVVDQGRVPGAVIGDAMPTRLSRTTKTTPLGYREFRR